MYRRSVVCFFFYLTYLSLDDAPSRKTCLSASTHGVQCTVSASCATRCTLYQRSRLTCEILAACNASQSLSEPARSKTPRTSHWSADQGKISNGGMALDCARSTLLRYDCLHVMGWTADQTSKIDSLKVPESHFYNVLEKEFDHSIPLNRVIQFFKGDQNTY